MRTYFRSLFTGALSVGAGAMVFGGAIAGDLPAVSGVNGKVAAAFGAMNDEGTGTLSGSFVTPLGHAFGLQIDGAIGSSDGDAEYGIGAHAFWRDPERALVGLYASYSGIDGNRDVNVGVAAGEAEAYFGRISLEGLAGIDYGYGQTDFFGAATVGYYPIDNLRLYGGYLHAGGDSYGSLGFEWQPGFASAPNVSLFADGLAGEDDNWSAMAGVRFYLGGKTHTLIQRHREDDPGDLGLRALGQALDRLQEKEEEKPEAAASSCPPGATPVPGGCVM
ncbi:hypothetical protein [Breoghania sp.]|uniref:hypothetical protein n=1 Tax=Breoghania sp. TaxID=2065378 RepID=UPI002AA6DB7F|nr:hypothetical protein [Breoghania sp.]